MLKSVFTYVESKPDFTECTFVIVRSYLSQWNIMTKINNVNLCVCLCVCVGAGECVRVFVSALCF